MNPRPIALIGATALLLALATTASAQLTVTLGADNSTIYYSISSVTPPDTSYCVTAVVIDGQLGDADGIGTPCTSTAALSGYITCQTLGPHTIGAVAYNASLQMFPIGQPQTVVVSAVPSFCNNLIGGHLNFDISNNDAETDRRVLLSNSEPGYPYPHYQAFLSKDRAIPIDLRVIFNGAQTPNVAVTLRVIDPADPSPYVAGPAAQPVPGSHPGDNVGPLPTLSGTDVVDNGNGTYSINSGANGAIETEMDLAVDARAGDNYQVVATATFPDGSTVTATSGVVTAWKRIFVEKRQMFRSGVPLATDAPTGVTHIIVPDIDINTAGDRIGHNDYLMLLHAPPFGQPKAGGFYQGMYQVAAHPHSFTIPTTNYPVIGKGTITTTGSTQIVGTQTHFNSQVNVDDVINVPTSSGGTEPRWVVAVQDNTHLTVNRATTSASPGLAYTIGDSNLVPAATYFRLTLNRPLSEDYQREPLVNPATAVYALNDSVARLNGGTVSSLDYFDSDDNFLTGAGATQWSRPFPAAFTEYIVLPQQPASAPNAVLILPRVVLDPTPQVGPPLGQRFVDKWFNLPVASPFASVSTDPLNHFSWSVPVNHQLLLVGDSKPTGGDAGITPFLVTLPPNTLPSPQVYTILYRGAVEAAIKSNTSNVFQEDADQIMRKVEVHELTHQWRVNGGPFSTSADHCYPEVSYDSPVQYPQTGNPPSPGGTPQPGTLFCLMSLVTNDGLMMPAPWNPSLLIDPIVYQYGNGLTTYHVAQVNGVWNSEYFGIRNVLDPWHP